MLKCLVGFLLYKPQQSDDASFLLKHGDGTMLGENHMALQCSVNLKLFNRMPNLILELSILTVVYKYVVHADIIQVCTINTSP